MKKNLLTVLILALLIVNIVLTSVMMFSMVGTNKKTAQLVTDIATVLNLELTVPGEEDAVPEIPLEDTATYDIVGTMTIPLASDDGKDHYIRFNISLAMNMKSKDYKTYKDTISEKETLIKDIISSTVTEHTVDECKNDTEGLKAEILANIQKLFDSDFIYKVAISEVAYQ